MTTLLERKTLLLAKSEAVYGTAPAMANVNAILIANLDLNMNPTLLQRDAYHGSISNYGIRVGKKIVTCSFDVEFKGKGTAPSMSAPIEQDPLLRAIGLYATDISGGVEYTPTSEETDMKSVALMFNYDGVQVLMEGCFGNMTWNLVAGNYGIMSFSFTGLYNTPTDVVQLTPAFVNAAEPPICESINLLLDSYNGCSENFTFDMGNEISERPCLNAAEGLIGVRITKRDATGQIDPEMMLQATKDFWTEFESSSKLALTATLGSDVGNQFVISMPEVQITNLTPGARNGIRTYTIDFAVTGDDDEFSIQAK